VWEYFQSLRLLVENARQAPSPELCRRAAALAVIMAVTGVEVFLNLWLRVRVAQGEVLGDRETLFKELSKRVHLGHKLSQWPQRFLSAALDLKAGPGGAFVDLKCLRNSIVHFTSPHESIDLGNVAIHGLADTTAYDELSAEKARWALQTAENFIAEIFCLSGLSSKQVSDALHAWTGRVPDQPRPG
jgi:hypothetical protein